MTFKPFPHWISPVDRARVPDGPLDRLDDLEANTRKLQTLNTALGDLSQAAPETGQILVSPETQGIVSGNILYNPSFEIWPQGGSNTSGEGWGMDPSPWIGTLPIREATTIYHGLYSAKITRNGGNSQFYQNIYVAAGTTYIRGKIWTFGAWMNSSVANQCAAMINDGTSLSPNITKGPYHPGDGLWHWMTVTVMLLSTATQFKVGMAVDGSDTVCYIDAAAITEGGTLPPAAYPTYVNALPKRWTMWHDESIVLAGTAKAYFGVANQPYGYLWAAPAVVANGDSFSHSFYVDTNTIVGGSYTMSVLGETNNANAMIDWYIDGVLVASGQDWYSAAQALGVIKTFNFTLAKEGYHVLIGTTNGKNAAAVNPFWRMRLTKYWVTPATDT